MRLDIPGLRVAKAGNDRALIYCPIHKGGREQRPAAYIYYRSGTWRCHACGRGGPVKDLLMSLGFGDDQASRVVSDLKTAAPSESSQKREYPTCPEYYLGAFGRRPLTLVNAGFDRKVLDHMEVGFDESRTRVIYPVRSEAGKLHGVVGGAVFPESDPRYPVYYGTEPKYLAYGPRQGFPYQLNPKWTLWNYKSLADRKDFQQPLVVVEGFKALLWVLMAGIDKVVATFGTAYETKQVDLLARMGCPILLFLDNDPAGREATLRLQKDLRRRTSGIGVVTYPRPVRQPDDLTAEEVKQCLS